MLTFNPQMPVKKSHSPVRFGAEPEPAASSWRKRVAEPPSAESLFSNSHVEAEHDSFVQSIQKREAQDLAREKREQAFNEKQLQWKNVQALKRQEEEKQAEAIRSQSNTQLLAKEERLSKLDAFEQEMHDAAFGLEQLSKIEAKVAEGVDLKSVLKEQGSNLPRVALGPQPQAKLTGPIVAPYIMKMLKQIPNGYSQKRKFFTIEHTGSYKMILDINAGSELYLKMLKKFFPKDKYFSEIVKLQEKHQSSLSANTKYVIHIGEDGELYGASYRSEDADGNLNKEEGDKLNEFIKEEDDELIEIVQAQAFTGMMMHRTWLLDQFYNHILARK